MATLVQLRDKGEPLPAAAACLSPWVDMDAIGESMTSNAEADLMIQKENLQDLAKGYLGGRTQGHH